jgi:hypothetical protein
VKAVIDVLMNVVASALRPRLSAIEKRLDALERRVSMEYRGTFSDGTEYQRGDVVTHAGSAWIAVETTTAKPGEAAEASRSWRLMVKRGRDGRYAR